MKRSDHRKSAFSRRDFLKIIAFSSAVCWGAKKGLDSLSRLPVTTKTQLLMGTVANITLVGPDQYRAQKGVQDCLQRMTSLESVLSRYQPESELSKLNHSGFLDKGHPAILQVITQALEISSLTGGAFDITIKPVLDLYHSFSSQQQCLPDPASIKEALSLVDYRQVHIDNSQIWFGRPKMEITLDGIAKGFIVDQGIRVLQDHGFSNVLVEVGGDLFANNYKYEHHPWQIGIMNPRGSVVNENLITIPVSHQAVATSGDYQYSFSDDFLANHIIHPHTGRSPRTLASVTVTAPSTMLADALGTAVLVMGHHQGLELIENMDQCQAILVSKDLEIYQTKGFPSASFTL